MLSTGDTRRATRRVVARHMARRGPPRAFALADRVDRRESGRAHPTAPVVRSFWRRQSQPAKGLSIGASHVAAGLRARTAACRCACAPVRCPTRAGCDLDRHCLRLCAFRAVRRVLPGNLWRVAVGDAVARPVRRRPQSSRSPVLTNRRDLFPPITRAMAGRCARWTTPARRPQPRRPPRRTPSTARCRPAPWPAHRSFHGTGRAP